MSVAGWGSGRLHSGSGPPKRALAELAQRLATIEGIERVLVGDEVRQVGQATPEEHPWAPDLWLAARRDYVFGEGASGEEVVLQRPTVGGSARASARRSGYVGPVHHLGARDNPGYAAGEGSNCRSGPHGGQPVGTGTAGRRRPTLAHRALGPILPSSKIWNLTLQEEQLDRLASHHPGRV